MELGRQVATLFLLAIPIASIAWAITHEEIFREPREYFVKKSQKAKAIWERKFFYILTCEYCFSHYVVIFFLIITNYTLLYTDWKGYLIAGFALVWISNFYMSLFALLRQNIKVERMEANLKEQELKETGFVADKKESKK